MEGDPSIFVLVVFFHFNNVDEVIVFVIADIERIYSEKIYGVDHSEQVNDRVSGLEHRLIRDCVRDSDI